MLWTEETEFTCRNIILVIYSEPINDAFIIAPLPYNNPLVNIWIPLSSKYFYWAVNVFHWTMKVFDIMRYEITAAVVYPYLRWTCIKLRFISMGQISLWVRCIHFYSVEGLKLTWRVTVCCSLVPPDLVIQWVGYSALLLMMVMKLLPVFTRWFMDLYPFHNSFGFILEKLAKVPYGALVLDPVFVLRYVAITVVFLM